MKLISLFCISLLMLVSCKEKTESKQDTEATEQLPSNSIFNLTSDWQNQDGKTIKLNDLQGKTLVVVMIYTTCKTACPILVAKMKTIESKFLYITIVQY